MSTYDYADASKWRCTTILSVRKNGKIVVVGDGQVSAGNTVMKSTAKKVRTLAGGNVITGFAGATADAFALFERLEAKLEQYPTQLARACVELAKDAGIKAVIQPGGSINDQLSIDFCDKNRVVMVLTGTRHFKH